MANGQVFTQNGKMMCMHRAFETVPTFTAPAFFGVGTGSSTPSIADTALQTPILINGSFTKAVNASYPTFDDSLLIVTTRALLLTTDSNGNSISEFGLFNSDATPALFSRAVFTPVTKTSDVQVIFVEKDIVQ